MERITQLAQQRGLSHHLLITEAVELYLKTRSAILQPPQTTDPLIGLFAGSPNLADCAEGILQQEIKALLN